VKIKHSESILECIEYMSNNLDKKSLWRIWLRCAFLAKLSLLVFLKSILERLLMIFLSNFVSTGAKRFLIETDLSLEEISSYTGFNGASHFIACFKKHENTTPYKYKNRYITSKFSNI